MRWRADSRMVRDVGRERSEKGNTGINIIYCMLSTKCKREREKRRARGGAS